VVTVFCPSAAYTLIANNCPLGVPSTLLLFPLLMCLHATTAFVMFSCGTKSYICICCPPPPLFYEITAISVFVSCNPCSGSWALLQRPHIFHTATCNFSFIPNSIDLREAGCEGCGLDASGSGWEPVAASGGYSNAPSVSLKSGEFLG
jgi:hypothetical protein